jgi:CheY-like chemotaxis protein
MPTVLIAEADRDLRDDCVQFLDGLGFEIDTAADGLECLSKLRRLLPDILILDLELLWGGGNGVVGLLRKDTQLLRKRVVLSSTVASPHVLQNLAFLLGIRASMKPFPQ